VLGPFRPGLLIARRCDTTRLPNRRTIVPSRRGIAAVSYQAMGLLPGSRQPNWYDAGRFCSGDDLPLSSESRLSGEIAVQVPADTPATRSS